MNASILGMSTTTLIIIAVVVVAVGAIVALLLSRRGKGASLQSRFGPEYERTLEELGDKRRAEAELRQRTKRVHGFDIHPLPADDKDRYVEAWRKVQGQFVDDPEDAVGHADDLLGQVMSARGYPVSDFDRRAADLSVDHPVVVQTYRAAHDTAVRHARGEASTEELRQAMIQYRALFDELVGQPAAAPSPEPETATAAHENAAV
jgi:hypothetical protein